MRQVNAAGKLDAIAGRLVAGAGASGLELRAPAILKGYCDRVFLAGIAFRLEDGKVKPAMTHIRKLGVVTTYGASWLRATLAAAPPRRLVTRAFRHAAQSDRLTCVALYGMNRAGQARCAGCLARVEHTMEQF